MSRRGLGGVFVAAFLVVGFVSGCTEGEPTPTPTSSPITTEGEAPGIPDASLGPETEAPRVIELELTSDLRIVQHGQQATDIAVTPGETIRFIVTNTADLDHDFYIGPDRRLAANRVADLPGLDTWSSREPRQLDWIVPEDMSDVRFGCTLRGHYPRMHGSFSIAK